MVRFGDLAIQSIDPKEYCLGPRNMAIIDDNLPPSPESGLCSTSRERPGGDLVFVNGIRVVRDGVWRDETDEPLGRTGSGLGRGIGAGSDFDILICSSTFNGGPL